MNLQDPNTRRTTLQIAFLLFLFAVPCLIDRNPIQTDLKRFNNDTIVPVARQEKRAHDALIEALKKCDADADCAARAFGAYGDEMRKCAGRVRSASTKTPEIKAVQDGWRAYFEACADNEEQRKQAIAGHDTAATQACKDRNADVAAVREKLDTQLKKLIASHGLEAAR